MAVKPVRPQSDAEGKWEDRVRLKGGSPGMGGKGKHFHGAKKTPAQASRTNEFRGVGPVELKG